MTIIIILYVFGVIAALFIMIRAQIKRYNTLTLLDLVVFSLVSSIGSWAVVIIMTIILYKDKDLLPFFKKIFKCGNQVS